MREMDAEQLRQIELKELAERKKNAVALEAEVQQFQKEVLDFERLGDQIKQNLQKLNQITQFEIPKLNCKNYAEGESIEDLDRIISRKWEQVEHSGQNPSFHTEEDN